jgi:protein phosphatase
MGGDNQIELDVAYALKEIVNNANEAILEEMKSRGNNGMGATFVGAFISPQRAWIAHVGDSRAYRIHRGVATQLTKDHSAVGRLLSQGLISEREAQNHPERNVIERALGFTTEDPEITEVILTRGDVILLCSDGVSTVLSAETMARCVMNSSTADAAVEDIVKSALNSNTDDNSTAVVAAFNWDNLKAYAPKGGTRKRLLDGFDSGADKRAGKEKTITIPLIPAIIFVVCVAVVAVLFFIATANGGGGGGDGGSMSAITNSNETENNVASEQRAVEQQSSNPEQPKVERWVLDDDISPVELFYRSESGDVKSFDSRIMLKRSNGTEVDIKISPTPNDDPTHRVLDGYYFDSIKAYTEKRQDLRGSAINEILGSEEFEKLRTEIENIGLHQIRDLLVKAEDIKEL